MPRGPLKYLASRILPDGHYRVFYVAVTSTYLTCICYFWAPMTYTLWDVQDQYLKLLVYGELNASLRTHNHLFTTRAAFFVLTGLGYGVSLLTLDPLELLGIRAPLNKVLKR